MKVTRTVRITHVVEYVIKATDEPGVAANYMGPGYPERSAEHVIDRVIEQLKYTAARGDNPTHLTAQYGGHYDMRQVGSHGNRQTTIEVDGRVVAVVESPK